MSDTFARALLNPNASAPEDVLDAGGRFETYRSNYFSRLIIVLNEQFPVTARLVGSEFFEATVQEYALSSPPTSPFLAQYGEKFPEFLKNFEPANKLPYLPDTARLEWLRVTALGKSTHLVFRISTERDLKKAILFPIKLAPGASVLKSEYPVGSIWKHHQLKSPKPISSWHNETVLIWRMNDRVHQMIISGEEEVLVSTENGEPFINHLQTIQDENQITALIETFVKFINLGILAPCVPENGEIKP
ncbi:HvfC/BufC family peptide modification chaperone [Sneathiella glossodoripedis]|uniref:HvfC/BufC family peptide modification chaperone n=1 Tax=Sneathiella glossodoripedis TaxID=418853 RepID=UPI00046EAEDD|nr:putative DNA-binding domain-containing protein [Sneathiella glossodoripedis]